MKTNNELFADCYAATYEASHDLSRLLGPGDTMNAKASRKALTEINRLLRVAICAASALESRLAGNEPPKEG